MSEYKLIATDLDGTLLNNRGELSEENIKAIENLKNDGLLIALSTGRTLSEIPERLKCNPNIDFLIGSNGAAIWNLKAKEKIADLSIPKALTNRIFDILREYRVNITYRYNGESFVDKFDISAEKNSFYNICEPHRKAVNNYANSIENFNEFSYSLENIETFALFFHMYEEMIDCEKKFLEIGDLSVVRAWDYNLEVFSKNSGKGNALKQLSDLLNISIEQVIAVGDSNNDTTMIEAAGLGLCVSNGNDSLKQRADKIICSNEEHIMKYILNNVVEV